MATATSYLKSRRVREATFTLVFGDTTAVKVLSLPSGVRLIGYTAHVKTALSGGTTQISIGTSTSASELVSAWSLAATGDTSATTQVVLPGHETSAITDIYAVVAAGNTAGEVDVTILFSLERTTRQ
jgi:hypothetical protein